VRRDRHAFRFTDFAYQQCEFRVDLAVLNQRLSAAHAAIAKVPAPPQRQPIFKEEPSLDVAAFPFSPETRSI
jgi:hypothetical protein